MVVDFMDCPHCRQRILEGSNFCRFCGKPVHNKLKNRFDCPECGATIKNYVDFCEKNHYNIFRGAYYFIL